MSDDKPANAIPLAYGDIILISSPFNDNLTLFSDGIVKSQIYLKNFGSGTRKKSFYRSLFQIYPSFINTHKTQALALRESKGSSETQDKKEKLEELKEKLNFEYKFNLEHFEKVRNTPITYGNSIQFLHLASNKFLACHFTEAEVEKENYKLELVDIPSEASNFKISPSYKHQKENEGYIYYKDLVYVNFANNYLNKTPYLHCNYHLDQGTLIMKKTIDSERLSQGQDSPQKRRTSSNGRSSHSDGRGVSINQNLKSDDNVHNSERKAGKKEINVSLVKCRWKINLFSHESQDKSFLSYGDTIWMNHAEHNASMIARKEKNGEVDFVQTIVSDANQQYSGNTNGMWIIENQSQSSGGLVEWDDEFRLKHLSSGKYLSVDYSHLKKKHILKLDAEKNEDSLFKFELMPTLMIEQLPQHYKNINKEAFIRIRSAATKLWLHVEHIGDRLEGYLLPEVIDDDIFKLFKANNNEIWETNFLISCFPILQNYLVGLEETSGKVVIVDEQTAHQKIEKRAKEAQECLMQLELFCTNRLLNTSLDQKYGEVNPYRQKVLREQYFLETLGEILKYSFTEAQIENYLNERDTQEDLKNKKGFVLQKLVRKAKIQSGKGNDFFLMEQKISICRLIYRLFKSICKENKENELYAYHIIDQFQYHAKYLEEAVDCFISIINSNEGILSRIGEDVKVSEVLEHIIQPAGAAAGPKKKIKLFNLSLALGIKDPNDYESQNFITYFLKLIYDNASHKRNLSYLRFLKSICVCEEKGMTINQEHLYKIFAASQALDKATFMETVVDEDNIRIGVDDKNLVSLSDLFKLDTNPTLWKNEMSYFLEQVSFYSTLLEGRNYLWKMRLEKQFPAGVVFEQIYNEKLSLQIRSVFCDLALALYIDQEPLNPRIVPNLCRVFKKKNKGGASGSMTFSLTENTHKLAQIDKENFVKLLENIVKIVEDQKKKILEDLEGKCENISEAKFEQLKVDNYLNNIVLAKLVKLLCKMVSFDLFLLLDGKSNYYQIVHDLLHILEFDKSSPATSYALMKIRDENYKKNATENKLGMFNVIGDFAGIVGDFSKDLVGNLKNVAGAMFGAEKKKSRSEIVGIIEEGDDALYVSNPIMKGLILLKNQIDQLNVGVSIEANNTEIMIKGEICDLLNYMLDLRQDYLLSNILGWYEEVVPKITGKSSSDVNSALEALIEREVGSIFPDISRTGLIEIDAKYRPKEENVVLDGLKTISKLLINLNSKKKKEPPKLTKFVNYTEEEEFPDLDTLFTGLKMTGKKEILPSLLTSFYMANDTHLENKLLTLIMRMFGQREESIDNLQKLEMVFERDDVEAYYKLERWSEDLRLQTQRSEIWLSDFILTKGEKDWELKNVMKLFKDITNLVFSNVDGNEKNAKSRQNMMRNLDSYTPMIGMIRDGAFHLKNALDDPNLPAGPKQQLIELFSVAHACLICFCHNNPENQELLSSNMKLFLSNLNIEFGQITLVCEICKDNKDVCEASADLIITSLLDAITKYGHKASFLEPLTALQKHKTGFLVENHIKIMNRFITASRALEETELKALYASINPDTKEVELTFQKILPMDEPFIYHARLFDVLMFDSQGNDSLIFTHTRLRKVFTVPYCLRLVQQITIPDRLLSARGVDVNDINISLRGDKRRSSVMGYLPLNIQRKYSGNVNTTQSSDPHEEGFRLLKPKVIQILGTLYLKGDKLLAEEFLEHLDLFVDFIKSEKESIQNLSEEFRPSAEFSDYLFKKLLCFTKDYVEKLILSNTDEARDRRDSAAILELVDIVYSKFPSLGLKISKEDATNFRALVRHYIDESTVTNSQVPYMLDSILRSKDSQRTAPDEVVNDKNEPPQKRYVYFESKEAANYSIYWQDFLNATTSSKTVNESVKNERAALSEAIWKFEEVFPKEYKKKYKIEIESKDIIRKLVVFLRDGQKNKADQGTMIATLRVFKEIIESAPDVTEMQNFFDKQDATRMLLTVLSDPKLNSIEDDLLNEFLEFGIALLEGGNQNVQKTIYTFCTVYSMSQLMFAKFHSIIYGQIYYLQARAELKNDPVKSTELEQAHGLKSEILERLLRFLQLFTEGHFEDLQNYLRYQTNSRNRYNIVEAIIDLLNTYSQDLVQSNYENIIKCLDTLNEFVQGPCKENQIALVDGKFFDVVLTLFNKKIRSKAKHRRKSKPESAKKSAYLLAAFMADGGATPQQSKELEPWMLARLKYKVLILVNSLLERSSKSVIKRVMRSLPLEVLKKNLVKIFKKYKELYGNTFVMESLKHFEGDPNDKDDLKPPGYYEMIIESGFMIYFLICSYTDLDTQDIDDDLLNELNELKETNLLDMFMPDMLQNNVVGQLATFGYTFVKSLVDTGNELRASFEKRFRKTKKLEIKENEEEKRIRKSLENQQLNKEAMQFFGQNSTSIEVARLGEIERIQFMVLPYCRELPKDEKNAFNENVNRQNPKTKVEGLVEESDKLIDMCKHELKLKLFFNRRKFIAIFTNFVNLWKDLAFFLSIILNALILTSYSAYFGDPGDVDNGRMSDPELFLLDSVSTESTIDIFVGIGIAMTICSIFVVFFFFLKRVPLILKKALDEKSIIKKIFKIVFYSLQSVDTVYYLAYGAFALFGLFIHPFFFAMHLTEILFRYPTLKNVIKSIWIPRKQLALTFLLFLVLTYFFSIYAYAYMDDIYNGNCESTLLCFKTTFDGTFKANGGIGGYNPAEPQGTFNTERFIFDNLANIILLIIMINIVAGIIIDTFGLLREQEEEKNADIQEKCFICGLDKDVFDRQADSSYNFNVHIKREHNMWAYIFFLAFLKEKDETEYTGIESYISDKVKNQELNWFPFSRALSLKHHDEQESENTKEALDYFNAETDEIKKSMKNLNEAYTTLTSRMNIN